MNLSKIYSKLDQNILKKYIDYEAGLLFTDSSTYNSNLKLKYKDAQIFELKVSFRGKGDNFGMAEWFLDSPSRITSVRWISMEAKVKYIEREVLLHWCRNVLSDIAHQTCKRLSVIYKGIKNYAVLKKAELDFKAIPYWVNK